MVGVDSCDVSRVTHYSGNPWARFGFRLLAFHHLWSDFPSASSNLYAARVGLLQPRGASSPVWALPLSFATTYGISSISFPLVTEMFHFTRYRFMRAMNSLADDPVLTGTGYPIRRSTGRSLFAAHRGLSQLITSFIACWYQGIHHVLLVAFLLRYLKLFCAETVSTDGGAVLRRLSKY